MSVKPEDPENGGWCAFWTILLVCLIAVTGALAVTGNIGAISTAIVVHAILSNIDKILE